MSHFIEFLQKNVSPHTFTVFASTAVYGHPAVDYAKTDDPLRTAFLGWIPGILQRHDAAKDLDKKFFIHMLAEDMNTKKPDFIFVDIQPEKNHIQTNFDFLQYLSQDAEFKQAWKAYRYVSTIEEPLAYKFQVYKRT